MPYQWQYDTRDVIMPFGKYGGHRLEDIPLGYLVWSRDTIDWDHRDIALGDAIREEIKRRRDRLRQEQDEQDQAWREQRAEQERAWREARERAWQFTQPLSGTDEIVKTWYRQLSLDFHPDRRKGSHEAMLAINEAYERLRKVLKLPPK
jgi:hypothetical protein